MLVPAFNLDCGDLPPKPALRELEGSEDLNPIVNSK
jgi:hypothetical protein